MRDNIVRIKKKNFNYILIKLILRIVQKEFQSVAVIIFELEFVSRVKESALIFCGIFSPRYNSKEVMK